MKQYKFGADFLHQEFKQFVYGYHAGPDRTESTQAVTLYVDCTYYLAPDGKTAADAFAVVQLNCSIPFPRQRHYTFDDWSHQLH
jgi:hypothetical protein